MKQALRQISIITSNYRKLRLSKKRMDTIVPNISVSLVNRYCVGVDDWKAELATIARTGEVCVCHISL